jgi:glycosyltransferase involved in cell wall biosynthesis
MRLGAVPEIVDEGVTGFTAATKEEFLQAIQRTLALERKPIRQAAEQRFSAARMARDYLQVYKNVARLKQTGGTPAGFR